MWSLEHPKTGSEAPAAPAAPAPEGAGTPRLGGGCTPARGSQWGLTDGWGLQTQPGGLKTQSGGPSGACQLNGVHNPSQGSQQGLQPHSTDVLPPLSPRGRQSLVQGRAEPPEPPPQSPSGPPPGHRELLLLLLLSLLRICRSSCSCWPGSASRCGDSMATCGTGTRAWDPPEPSDPSLAGGHGDRAHLGRSLASLWLMGTCEVVPSQQTRHILVSRDALLSLGTS